MHEVCAGRGRPSVAWLAVCVLGLSASAGAAPPPPVSGLVAAYGFEEGSGTTTADASGNGLTGTVSSATWTTAGKYGKALVFAGASGSWVTVPNAAALNLTTGMTISAWVKPSTSLPQWPAVVMKERTGELTYALYANSDTAQPNINYTSNNAEVNLNAGSAVPVNVWTHLAGTFDGSMLRLYVNGQVVGSKATSAPIDTTTGVLRIGGDSVWPGEYFPGTIDEVRIYNRALSLSELQTDMATPIVGSGAPPDTTPPTVTLDSPASGFVVSGNVSLTASASDNVGVASVRFLVDAIQIGAAITAAPYTILWNSAFVPDGTHTLTAIARDTAGNETTSTAVTVSSVNASTSTYPLKLAPGQRFIVDQNNQPFFIHGEAAWSLIANLRDEDVDRYLDDRQNKGFNALIVNLLEHQYAANAPSNAYGDAPFLVAGDFTKPNEAYFAHADLVLQKAAARGMVVFLTPAYLGFNGGSEGWYQEMSTAGTAALTTYGKFLGDRYKNYPNIVWLDGGDYNPPNKALVTAIVNGIKTFDPAHLHTAHVNQGSSPVAIYNSEGWLDFSNVYTYPVNNNAVPVYNKSLAEYGRSNWKPFFLAESTYEGEYSAPQTLIRQQAYEALLSGAMGDFFGNRPIWLFDPGWDSALNSRGSLDMVNVRLFFTSRHWEKLVPDSAHTFVTAGLGNSTTTHLVAARASDGSWGAAYIPTARTITVSLNGFSGIVSAHWYDPTSGAMTTATGSPFTNAGTINLTTPGLNATATADWVLVFDLQ